MSFWHIFLELDFIAIGVGIAIAGYCIGTGLHSSEKTLIDQLNEENEDELVNEDELEMFLGIPKADTKVLVKEYPDVPYIRLNGNVYFNKKNLRKWFMDYKK
ncbi:DNA-binding protein [Aquibacillus rhizosphaerae]|uniref:DNA-binding protein n=1 Tax=Aquibacillus rhizosphaerae TaxID=3051431 RepID=A0ABT7LCE9_9BACI|nr:DNA-binding protein [Aquibacillus sp. LR5S19]MDL4843109.1 DNA-binding protein [Aquibacillus sp. LR5S19]